MRLLSIDDTVIRICQKSKKVESHQEVVSDPVLSVWNYALTLQAIIIIIIIIMMQAGQGEKMESDSGSEAYIDDDEQKLDLERGYNSLVDQQELGHRFRGVP